MDKLDLLILAGDKPRHKYFAIKLLERFAPSSVSEKAGGISASELNAKVIVEKSAEYPWAKGEEQLTPLMKKHLADFEKIEQEFFGETISKNEELLKSKTLQVLQPGTINEKENVDFIKSLNPKLIAVHSTSIIKEGLIRAFPKKVINLHAGLSPYYRGSGTNFYPFYNKELEYVGMTVHYLDVGIDSGDIILQGRPNFDEKDNTHTTGCKNVILGTELMAKVIGKYLKEGAPESIKQDLGKGKLYLKKQFNDEAIRTVYHNIEKGLVKEYIKKPKKVPIVMWGQWKTQ